MRTITSGFWGYGFVVGATAAAVLLGALRPASAQIVSDPYRNTFRIFQIASINGTASLDDGANAVTTDSQNRVIACGYLVNNNFHPRGTVQNRDFTVTKSGSGGWTRALAGSYFDDEANAVDVDSQDNVIAAGTTGASNNTGASIGTRFTVAKWSPTGTLLWEQRLAGTYLSGFGPNEALAVTTDSQGHAIAAGYMTNASTDAGGNTVMDEDFTVVKLDAANGAEIWRKTVRGTRFGFTDRALAVAVDASDNVFATGFVKNFGSDRDIPVRGWDAAGNPLMDLMLGGSVLEPDEAHAITVDGSGRIIVAGFVTNRVIVNGSNVDNRDFFVAKCRISGAVGVVDWSDSLTGTQAGGADFAKDVTADAQGNVIAAGFRTNTGSAKDMTVMKWSSAGARQAGFPVDRNGTANGEDEARGVAVDSAGVIAAGGFVTNTNTMRDFALLRLGAAGSVIWSPSYNGTLSQDDIARDVAIDGTGWVVAAGTLRNGPWGIFSTTPRMADYAVAF